MSWAIKERDPPVTDNLAETIIKNRIIKLLSNQGMIWENRHGFWKRKFYFANLRKFFEHVNKIVHNGGKVKGYKHGASEQKADLMFVKTSPDLSPFFLSLLSYGNSNTSKLTENVWNPFQGLKRCRVHLCYTPWKWKDGVLVHNVFNSLEVSTFALWQIRDSPFVHQVLISSI